MFKRFLKKLWDGLVHVVKAVADAVGLTALPLHVIRGDASLASACKAAVPHVVSQANIVKTGAVTKAVVAKVVAEPPRSAWLSSGRGAPA